MHRFWAHPMVVTGFAQFIRQRVPEVGKLPRFSLETRITTLQPLGELYQ